MKLQPPHITDQPIIALIKRIGIEPGKSFDLDKADPAVKKALEHVPQGAQEYHEGSGAPRLNDAVKTRESRHYSVAALPY